MTITKKAIIYIIIIGIISGGYIFYKNYSGKNGNSSLSFDINKFDEKLAETVSKRDMISALDFYGSTKIRNQQKLKFNHESRVTGVFKKVGDNVKKGELIAELDKSGVLSQIEISKLNVANANLKLERLVENNGEVEVRKSRLNLDKLKEGLENAKLNLTFFEKEQETKISEMEKTLTQKETEYRILQEEVKLNISGITLSPSQKEQELQKLKNSLATSELEYERDSSNFDLNSLKKKNEYLAKIEKEYISIDESIRSLNKTFNSLDLLLRIMPDKNYDNNYLTYYSAKNDSYRNNSITSLQKSYTLYKKLDEQLKEVKDRTNMQKLIELIDIELDLFQNLSSAGEQIMKGLDNSVETSDFNTSVISNFYTEALNLYTLSNSKIVSLKTLPVEMKTLKGPEELKKDMENDLLTKKSQIEELKLSIKKLENDAGYTSLTNQDKLTQEGEKLRKKKEEIDNYAFELEKLKLNNSYEVAGKKRGISEYEVQIGEAEKNLKNLLDISLNQELFLAQNDLKQAKISLENEQKKLEAYELRAPFDGDITKLDYQVGDNLTQNDDKYILLENNDILEINVFVDQVDIMKLVVGQKALVTYDAFPGIEFNAEVVEIDSTPQDKNGVTKYEVKVFLERQGKTIFSGMKAKVLIFINDLPGVLSVPFTAVNTDLETGEEFVVVLNSNGQKQKKVVKTGYSDGINTEIVEGLSEGEKVLRIDYGENKYKPEDFEDKKASDSSGASFRVID